MKTFSYSLVATAMLAMAGSASAQNSANANATAHADVVCPINIVNQSNLYFGTLVGGTGTAHVTAAGTESYTGNVDAGSHSGTHTPAQFLITGESGFTYAQTRIPASGTLTVTDGAGHSAIVQLDGPVSVSGTMGVLTSCGGTFDPVDHGSDTHGNDIGNDNDHNGEGDDNGNHGNPNNVTGGGGCCGTQTYNVGGLITLNGTQPPGDYSNANTGGTNWVETVTYN